MRGEREEKSFPYSIRLELKRERGRGGGEKRWLLKMDVSMSEKCPKENDLKYE